MDTVIEVEISSLPLKSLKSLASACPFDELAAGPLEPLNPLEPLAVAAVAAVAAVLVEITGERRRGEERRATLC